MRRLLLLAMGLSALALCIGCGVSDGSLNNAEKRIKALVAKGVPDSTLSRARVLLYQAREGNKQTRWGYAKASADSMRREIAMVEALYKDKEKAIQATVSEMRSAIQAARATLTGLPAHKLDSMVAKADSFANIGWVLQTEGALKSAYEALSGLKFNQSRAEELRPRLPGEWTCTQVEKSDAHPEVNMPKTQTFELYPDGKAIFTQKGKGRATQFLKQDYEFINYGTWDVLGDTVFIFVNRFKRVREQAWENFQKGGKEKWEERSTAPCDSAITDGSQDLFVTYADLTLDFKQVKKY